MEGNKYKLLMKIPLTDLEIVKGKILTVCCLKYFLFTTNCLYNISAKDENLRRIMHEVETLSADANTLTQISEQVAALHSQHSQLEEMVRELLHNVNKQLSETQHSDTQLCYMEISLSTP